LKRPRWTVQWVAATLSSSKRATTPVTLEWAHASIPAFPRSSRPPSAATSRPSVHLFTPPRTLQRGGGGEPASDHPGGRPDGPARMRSSGTTPAGVAPHPRRRFSRNLQSPGRAPAGPVVFYGGGFGRTNVPIKPPRSESRASEAQGGLSTNLHGASRGGRHPGGRGGPNLSGRPRRRAPAGNRSRMGLRRPDPKGVEHHHLPGGPPALAPAGPLQSSTNFPRTGILPSPRGNDIHPGYPQAGTRPAIRWKKRKKPVPAATVAAFDRQSTNRPASAPRWTGTTGRAPTWAPPRVRPSAGGNFNTNQPDTAAPSSAPGVRGRLKRRATPPNSGRATTISLRPPNPGALFFPARIGGNGPHPPRGFPLEASKPSALKRGRAQEHRATGLPPGPGHRDPFTAGAHRATTPAPTSFLGPKLENHQPMGGQ